MADGNPYTFKFSHEFEDGPSGPARSYWVIDGPGMRSHGTPICLHPRRSDAGPERTMQSLCYALERAHVEGQMAKAAEVRRVIGS